MSHTTTITDSAVIASYNRGPLTTVFTPPSSCLSTLTFNSDVMYFGHADTYYYDSSCYPSSYSSTYTLLADNGDWNQYYYSPAQCPEAWAHATTFTSYFTNAADTPGQILFSLGSDTTAVLCCPSGYVYFGEAGHQCGSTVQSSGAKLLYVSTSLSNNAVVLGKPITTTITSSGYTIWGDGIPIWWQSSDLAAFTAPAQATTQLTSTRPTSTNTGSSPTATSGGVSSPSPESGSSGLSSGAKVAIGVTIPVVVIAVVLGIFFYFRRRGTRTAGQDNIRWDKSKHPNYMGELPADGALSELENRPPQQRYELPDRAK